MTETKRAWLLSVGAAVATLSPMQGHAVGSPRSPQLIQYSSMSTWGSTSGTCTAGGSDQRIVRSSVPFVCVSVRFAVWRGYHRGRITLTSPHGLNTPWSSFNGKTNHPIVHAFSIQTVDLVGTWTAGLRVDGHDIAGTTFAVFGSAPAPTKSTSGSSPIAVSPGAPPPGYSVTEAGGEYQVTDLLYGARLDLSRFTLTRDPTDGRSVLSFYARATKVPSRSDATAPTWQPGDSILRLLGSNLHPYAFYSTFCSGTPFHARELRNGQSTEGWMCSEGIPASSTSGSYTLTWTGAGYTPAPVLNILLTVSAP